MKLDTVLIMLFYIVTKSYIVNATSCIFDRYPTCQNKTHPSCIPKHKSEKELINITGSEIIDLINDNRSSLRNATSICNLPNIQWSEEIKNLTYATLNLEAGTYCRVTKAYGNLIIFSHNFTAPGNKLTVQKLKNLFNKSTSTKIQEKLSWIKSPYTKEIGCIAYHINKITTSLVCMVNGPKLKSSPEFYGYGNVCGEQLNIFISKKSCNQNKINCDYEDHIVCSNKLPKIITIIKLDYTSVKFLEHKLQQFKNSVVWDHNLQHLVGRILEGNLTGHEQCLTKKNYPKTNNYIFGKEPLFTDQISNIEYLLTDKNVSGRIGCAFYTVEKKVVLYCITANNNRKDTILDLIFGIDACTEMDILLIYGLLLLTYFDILAVIIFIYIFRQYQQKQLIFSFRYSEPNVD